MTTIAAFSFLFTLKGRFYLGPENIVERHFEWIVHGLNYNELPGARVEYAVLKLTASTGSVKPLH